MKKILLAVTLTLGLASCGPVLLEPHPGPYVTSHVVAIQPQYSIVAVGYPYARFERQVTGYRITYVRNGVLHTTYSKTPYGVGDVFFN